MADVVVTWTPFALRCLDEVHYYIFEESGSISPANNFVEKIFARTRQLATFPESGMLENFLNEKGIQARYLVEGNYKIIYEYLVDKKVIVVLDIFHTRQNPKNILNR